MQLQKVTSQKMLEQVEEPKEPKPAPVQKQALKRNRVYVWLRRTMLWYLFRFLIFNMFSMRPLVRSTMMAETEMWEGSNGAAAEGVLERVALEMPSAHVFRGRDGQDIARDQQVSAATHCRDDCSDLAENG